MQKKEKEIKVNRTKLNCPLQRQIQGRIQKIQIEGAESLTLSPRMKNSLQQRDYQGKRGNPQYRPSN